MLQVVNSPGFLFHLGSLSLHNECRTEKTFRETTKKGCEGYNGKRL